MSTIYIDASRRRPYPRLPGVCSTSEYIAQGGGYREVFVRALRPLQRSRSYFTLADKLIIAAANSCNVAAMELLLDLEDDPAFKLDPLRGLRFATVDAQRGRPPSDALPSTGDWKRMREGYSTTLPIHQVISRGTSASKSLSMLSLLIERAGPEQLSVCTRLGEWISRPSSNSRIAYTSDPIGGQTILMRAMEEGQLEAMSLMLSKDPRCADAVTTTGLRIEQLFIPSEEAKRLLQAHRAAVHARSVVADLVSERQMSSRRSLATGAFSS